MARATRSERSAVSARTRWVTSVNVSAWPLTVAKRMGAAAAM